MNVRLILASIAIGATTMAMAQENRFSAGLELGLPMGDFGDAAGVGFGVTLGYEIPIGDNLGFMAQAGYINFSGKDIENSVTINGTTVTTTVEGKSQGVIPIQVGLKYYFTDNQEGFYAGLLTGVHMSMVKVPEVDLSTGVVGEKTETNTNFSLAPELGYIIGENIDVALRYQMLFAKSETMNPVTFAMEEETVTNSYLGIRIAYMFGSR